MGSLCFVRFDAALVEIEAVLPPHCLEMEARVPSSGEPATLQR